jgi:hypothetical protein
MKTYLKEIFPKIKRYSKKLDDIAILSDKPWVLVSEKANHREVWIFKNGGDLIISRNGIAEKGKWEYYKSAKSIFIEVGSMRRLFKQAFIDDIALLMKLDDANENVFAFANELKVQKDFKILDYVNYKYLYPRKGRKIPKLTQTEKEASAKKNKLDILIDGARVDTQKYEVSLVITVLITALLSVILFSPSSDKTASTIVLIVGIIIISIIFFLFIRSRKFLKILLNDKAKKAKANISKVTNSKK